MQYPIAPSGHENNLVSRGMAIIDFLWPLTSALSPASCKPAANTTSHHVWHRHTHVGEITIFHQCSRSAHCSMKLLTEQTGQGPLSRSSLITKGPTKEICGYHRTPDVQQIIHLDPSVGRCIRIEARYSHLVESAKSRQSMKMILIVITTWHSHLFLPSASAFSTLLHNTHCFAAPHAVL